MSRDVRMRGFGERVTVEVARARLDPRILPLEAESVAVTECVGRVASEPIRAAASVPHFRRSAMDGFAVRAGDLANARADAPTRLRLLGEARPGRPFAGVLEAGTTVGITTGAPVPEGADAILVAEQAETRGAEVLAFLAISPGKHVASIGEDVFAGTIVVAAGRRLRPQDAGLLASVGRGQIPVIRRPRVALFVTGDELLRPGSLPEGARIVDANSVVLSALCERDGATRPTVTYVRDDRRATADALASADADVLLVSGGTSVGPEDHAPLVLAELGELLVHGVALRPAAPTGFGFLGGTRPRVVFLLPGNPVACLCAYEVFAGPTIRAMGGISREFPHKSAVFPLGAPIASAVGRTDYVRVRITDGRVFPLMTSGASILSSTTQADGVLLVSSEQSALDEGARVRVWLYDDAVSG